ncbi:helix-turn-helix domain-containing protein [Bradyrhizobium sp. LCT2]|uniref:helix-turn-helix domain-containing protein n=1 Tax=Bradyrhizobium sp. LCT2 TaxID=2493093 RepID=UPI001FEFF2DE|nr:helix-turn-helix domain-containing protein [Bradyrhizobium sp. LCT2]
MTTYAVWASPASPSSCSPERTARPVAGTHQRALAPNIDPGSDLWVEDLGSRPALPRVAHLICELAARLEIVGLLEGSRFRLPLTQADFAEACGLSIVHMNRTIQELRRKDLIAPRSACCGAVSLKKSPISGPAIFTPCGHPCPPQPSPVPSRI